MKLHLTSKWFLLLSFLMLPISVMAHEDQDVEAPYTHICENGVPMDDNVMPFDEFIDQWETEWGVFSQFHPRSWYPLGQNTYWAEDSTVQLDLDIYNGADNNIDLLNVRFIVLLNEQLVNAIDGEPYADISIARGEGAALQVTLDDLPTGLNDVILIGLRDPGMPLELGEARITYTHRVTLLVGNNNPIKERQYQDLPETASFNDGVNNPAVAFGKDDSFSIWNDPYLVIDHPTRQPLVFNVKVGHGPYENPNNPEYPDADSSEFALLFFDNFQQITLLGDETVFYARVADTTAYTQVDLIHEFDPEPAYHEIMVIRVEYPGVPMCILSDAPEGFQFDELVQVDRVGVNIVPE